MNNKNNKNTKKKKKKQRHYFASKDLSTQGCGFSSSHIRMWELKSECWRIDAFELWCWRRLSLDYKEIKPVNPKGNQSWLFIGRAEAETPILWLLMRRTDSFEKTLMLWKVEGRGTTEDEMVGWHHRLDGYEFEQAPIVGDGLEAWHAAVHGVTKSWTWFRNWTELKCSVSVG